MRPGPAVTQPIESGATQLAPVSHDASKLQVRRDRDGTWYFLVQIGGRACKSVLYLSRYEAEHAAWEYLAAHDSEGR